MSATKAQTAAIEADGNVLVTAGAGAGKTSTLVARCVSRLLDTQPRAGVDEILMVTFTDAAAAEMRRRICEALEEALASRLQDVAHIEEQLALLDTANICTLHSFCYRLVRQHFHTLGIDPQLVLLDEAQAAVLMGEILDEVFQEHYQGDTNAGKAVLRLIQNHASGREQPIRELVLKLHHYSQTLVSPTRWLDEQQAMFKQPDPSHWREWLLEALQEFRDEWTPMLRAMAGHELAQKVATELEALSGAVDPSRFATVFAALPDPKTLKPKQRLPEEFVEQAGFLGSLLANDGRDPLREDWDWVRDDMAALLELARQFARTFAEAKREQGVLDFHDLEQFTLRLLLDEKGEPTSLAHNYQDQFRFVFVDECQDINAAQDAIIGALSRSGTEANRFLVGDVKQSIYRFRLADPRIFQRYNREWRERDSGARVLSLNENFRSREGLLDFFNSVFAEIMREEIGHVQFDSESSLDFGARDERASLTRKLGDAPRVQVHLRLTSREDKDNDPNGGAIAELTAAEQEARIVANALKELRETKHAIWKDGKESPVEWGDMAILLRAVRGKLDVYAREFARQGIPLEAAQADFFSAREIADLLNALTILDNPLQDVPLIALLHSPLVGLNENELAEVRLANRGAGFWAALNRFHEVGQKSSAWPKIEMFLARFGKWRRMGRDSALSARLQSILTDTHYLEWLAANAANPARAEMAAANVQRLLTLSEQFDPLQRHGLPRFLKFVEAQQQVVSKEALATSGNAVQLISIHRSKGLEYPVVVLPDLGKKFNLRDLSSNVVLDTRFGLCARVKPPQTGRRYPSLPHWMSARRERAELLGEEMRLLYVGMTRARDTLLLVGTASRKTAESWSEIGNSVAESMAANSMLAWLGPSLARKAGADWLGSNGDHELFSWRIHTGAAATQAVVGNGGEKFTLPDGIEQICATATCEYPFRPATRETAKTSVSALRRKLAQEDEEARPWRRSGFERRGEQNPSAADIGTAHHLLLECVALTSLASEDSLRHEASRLVAEGVLLPEHARALDFAALADFWSGDVGRGIIEQAQHVQREMPFTARFQAEELRALGLVNTPAPADEFVIIQGVADLAVVLPKEIWLLDFKTDDVSPSELLAREERYRTQLVAYAAALQRIFDRPVTRRWLHFFSARVTRLV